MCKPTTAKEQESETILGSIEQKYFFNAKQSVPYEKLYIHFYKLFNDPNTSNILPSAFDVNYQNDVLNMPFHIHEISESIKLLKINKASGKDELINEYFKNATVDMIPTITHLFNIILNSGIIPSEWTKGIIKPLYKNKGNADEPEN